MIYVATDNIRDILCNDIHTGVLFRCLLDVCEGDAKSETVYMIKDTIKVDRIETIVNKNGQ